MYKNWYKNRNIERLLQSAGLAVLIMAIVGLSPAAFGQGVTGRLLGTVQDTSRAVIPKAHVVITNVGTGVQTVVSSDPQGDYVAVNLAPGDYRVQVTAPGFGAAVSSSNVVTVGRATRVDFTLKVGETSQAVEVKAAAPLIDSTSSSMGAVLNTREIQSLPLNGRIFSQLVQTIPGSIAVGGGNAPESASGVGAQGATTASVNGLPWQGTTYTVDGVSDMELLNAFVNIAPPLDSLQEIKVSTNDASADVGTYGGAQVNAYLKSGTNHLHGSLYEFYRNASLNARTWSVTGNAPKAPFKSNEFGGSIGGPILRNKMFFFVDYQGNRLQNGKSYTLSVPTQLMKQGLFLVSQFPKGVYDPTTGQPFPQVTTSDGMAYQIPVSRFDPVAAQMVAGTDIWPNPSIANALTNNFQQNVVENDSVNSVDAKFDAQLSSDDHLFARESYQRRNLVAPSPGTPFIQIGDVNSDPRDHNADVGWDHVFSPTVLNELRLGFNRFDTHDFGNDSGSNENTKLGIPNGNLAGFPGSTGLANFKITNISTTGTQSWTNSQRLTNTYELTDNLTLIKGRHTITLGTDLRRLQATLTNADVNQSGIFQFNPDYTSSCTNQPTCSGAIGGNAFAGFLLGLPSQIDRGIVNTDPATRVWLVGTYAQDDYRVTSSLTLNLALRWDLITNPVDKFNRQSNFDLSTGMLDLAQAGNRGPNVSNYMGGFAPRVGFAYSPDRRTAIRGAFGMSHFPDHYGAIGGTLERNYPFFEQFSQVQQLPYTPFAQVSVTGLPGFVPTPSTTSIAPPPNLSVYYFTPNFRPDEATTWNFGIERQLTSSTALDIAYVGTKGTNLFRSFNIDIPAPGPGAVNPRRPYSGVAPNITNISERGSNGSSIYHALQVKFRKSFSSGLQAQFSYTWSKEIDDMNVFVPFNDALNRGVGTSSAPDVPHNFIASYVYQLPFGKGRSWLSGASGLTQLVAGGWQLSGITAVHDGTPLVIGGLSGSLLNNGISNRANIGCGSVATPGTPQEWFDTTCFTTPAQYQYGNSGVGHVRGPGLINFDMSMAKSIAVGEGKQVRLQIDAFNVLNTPHFSNPNTNMTSSTFGQITGTSGPARELQLGVHFTF